MSEKKRKSGEIGMGKALLCSVAFHGVVVGWLVFFSPVRIIDPNAPAARVSQARARQVVDQLRERQEEPLSKSLAQLADIRRELAEIEKEKREEYLDFAEKSLAQASPEAASLQDDVTTAQKEIVKRLEDSVPDLELFAAKRSNANFDKVFEAHEKARELHARTLAMQERVLGVLSLGDSKHAAAATAQQAANQAQVAVAKAFGDLEEALDVARGSRQRSPLERDYEHYTYHVARSQERIAEAPAKLEQNTRRTVAVEAMAKTLEADLAAATGDQKAKLESQREVVRKELADLAEAKELAVVELERAVKDLPGLQEKVSQIEADLAKAPQEKTVEDSKVGEVQAQVVALQRQAIDLQTAARAEVDKLPADAVPADLREQALAAIGEAPVPEPAAIGEQDLPAIYQEAVESESEITEAYRRFRAMELSMIRRIPLAQALGMTDVGKTARPDLSQALGASADTGEEVREAREGLQRARSEMSSMVHGGNSLLSQARGMGGDGGASVSFDEAFDKNQQWEMLQALAAEDEAAWAKDLTGMMGGDGPWGAGGEGDGQGEGGNGPAGGGAGGGGPFGVPGGGPGGFGPGGGQGGAGGNGFLPGGPGGPPSMGDPRERKFLPALPGRRIASQGPSLPWVFADSWYILGPFDNPRRRNIDTKFPPETVVDLNATYPGKNGVPIQWEFFQSGTANVMPPFRGYNRARRIDGLSQELTYRSNLQYAIYYATTELYFEKDCDLWVAIGSDDYSKVWINDQPVWASGKGAKAWRPDEGYRKVRFKAGVNRVLYRVENGNDRTEFSLMIGMEQ